LFPERCDQQWNLTKPSIGPEGCVKHLVVYDIDGDPNYFEVNQVVAGDKA